jgi:hypothetical protein
VHGRQLMHDSVKRPLRGSRASDKVPGVTPDGLRNAGSTAASETPAGVQYQ